MALQSLEEVSVVAAKKLVPSEVIAMPLIAFEQRFGFRPEDALEKKWFAITGNRLTTQLRVALKISAIASEDSLADVVME